MKKRYLHYIMVLSIAFIWFSCNDYLDVMPDNRTELDSEEKISKLLVSAYPENAYILNAELSSDNTDNYGENNPYGDRYSDEVYHWQDVKEKNNEGIDAVWSACYGAIASANQALEAIKELGNPESLNAVRGEALIARAYSHFILVNMFCQHYSEQHAEEDLGVPYMEEPEKELFPKYERGTLARDYELMAKDIEEGLPLINDNAYSVPKYHFNQKAAYTFASRFYLFYQKWDKVIEYASVALGSAPAALLRDYAKLVALPRDLRNVGIQYTGTSMKSNFLVQTSYSNLGIVFGAYYDGSRYNHGSLLAKFETHNLAPWGAYPTSASDNTYGNMYKLRPYIYGGTNLDKTLFPRIPYQFEYTDPVAGIGYRRAVYAALTAEEALLNRAEAYVMKEQYDNALSDINLWTGNTLDPARSTSQLTEAGIQAWATGLAYYEPNIPTPKKRLNPDFATIADGSKQESFIHCLLYMRRHEFIHEGMRWFDVKRWGIEIYRRTVNADGRSIHMPVDDKLTVRDNRRAIQLPQDVITAGITPNPR
ncbi:MAG: RagB/SusD family nutrient uptake outer membrane protein [Prevotella sp.]|nr:RagB/SusD family nutrient uptake outer membrane protein [Prevotella sp.]